MHPEHQQQSQPIRILLAEDDPLQQAVLKSFLAAQGYEVEVASDGLDALWKIREGKYDLALIDYELPEINGFAMAKLIRDLMGMVARPVLIALTGSPDAVIDKEMALGSAFDAVVSKRAGAHEMISTVRSHLDARPDAAARKGAELSLFLNGWTDYDADRGSSSDQADQSAPPRILVVEDDELQRSVLKSALETRGYNVEVALNGLQAVRMIRESAFDLALVDYQMPEMDGLATGRLVLDLLNEDARPRMIAFTSTPSQLIGRLADTGSAFDEVVAKSAGVAVLLATVERHLRSSPRSATRRATAAVFQSAA